MRAVSLSEINERIRVCAVRFSLHFSTEKDEETRIKIEKYGLCPEYAPLQIKINDSKVNVSNKIWKNEVSSNFVKH